MSIFYIEYFASNRKIWNLCTTILVRGTLLLSLIEKFNLSKRLPPFDLTNYKQRLCFVLLRKNEKSYLIITKIALTLALFRFVECTDVHTYACIYKRHCCRGDIVDEEFLRLAQDSYRVSVFDYHNIIRGLIWFPLISVYNYFLFILTCRVYIFIRNW